MNRIKTVSTGYVREISLLSKTFAFIRIHFSTLLALGCIAAFGRVLQLGGFGEISPIFNSVLEVVIESSRIYLFIYVLGEANIRQGLNQILEFFTKKHLRKQQLQSALTTVKQKWHIILISLSGYCILAFLMNFLIDASAYQTCFLLHLKTNNILESTASEWSMLLFLKNLSVIPFTIIFETLLILWIARSGNAAEKKSQI